MTSQVLKNKTVVALIAATLLSMASFGASSAENNSANGRGGYDTLSSPGGTKQPPP